MSQSEVSAAANKRGIIAMLSAMAMFVVNDAMVKLATLQFPVGQLMALRAVFASLFVFSMVAFYGVLRDLPKLFSPLVLMRAGLEGCIAFLFISALKAMPIANVTTLLMASSLILTVLAVALGFEVIGWRRIAALLVGFLGVVIAVRPGVDGFTLPALLALAAAGLVAVRELVTRRIAADIPTVVVALSTTLATGLVGAVLGANEPWIRPPLVETSMLIVAALMVAGGNFAIIIAYRGTDVSIVSGYRYSIVVFALILGFLIWGDVPDLWSMLGSLLIVGSGLYTLHRERVRRREAATLASAGNRA
jgi:drug/metabolite transporter (DMT)-like permease